MSGEDIRGRLYLVSDASGAELCLRPDYTAPVCLAYLASPEAGKPAQYAYLGPVFRARPGQSGEMLQTGLESYGRADIEAADAEILALALEAAELAGAGPLKVKIGDAKLFDSALSALRPARRLAAPHPPRPGARAGAGDDPRQRRRPGRAVAIGRAGGAGERRPRRRQGAGRGSAGDRRHRDGRRPQRRRDRRPLPRTGRPAFAVPRRRRAAGGDPPLPGDRRRSRFRLAPVARARRRREARSRRGARFLRPARRLPRRARPADRDVQLFGRLRARPRLLHRLRLRGGRRRRSDRAAGGRRRPLRRPRAPARRRGRRSGGRRGGVDRAIAGSGGAQMTGAEAAAEAPLVLAVPSKGRLQENASQFFARAGLEFVQGRGARDYRGVIADLPGVEVAFLSASEIVGQLAAGAAHFGVTGEDLVREHVADADNRLVLLAPLGFGRANVVVAAPQAWIDVRAMADLEDVAASYRARRGERMRVATKYVNLTRRFFAEHGVTDYRIVESLGATEGAPAAGAAELIVDITTTGATLAANALKTLEDGVILRSQATLVASPQAPWSPAARAAARAILTRIAAAEDARKSREVRARLPTPVHLIVEQACALFDATPALGDEPDPHGFVALHCARAKAADLSDWLLGQGAVRVSVVALEQVFDVRNPLYEALEARIGR